MTKYNSEDFISALQKKIKKDFTCPFCGCNHFSGTEYFATILTGSDLSSINIGTSVPSGIIICENCGHMDFFALGAFGLLTKDGENDGKQ